MKTGSSTHGLPCRGCGLQRHLDRGAALGVEGAEIDQERIGAGDEMPISCGDSRHRRHGAGREQHIRGELLGDRIGDAMHTRAMFADASQDRRW